MEKTKINEKEAGIGPFKKYIKKPAQNVELLDGDETSLQAWDRFGSFQRDQIWRNFATVTKKSAFVTKLGANLVFGTLLNKLKRIFYAIGQICIVVNGQILNKSSGNLVPLLVSASRSGNLFVGRTSTSCSRAAAKSTTTSWSCSSWSMRARLLQVFFFCL